MKPGARKLVLTAHVTSSVGWLGSVVVFLVLAIAGLTSGDAQLARAAYLSLELIGWVVIVPASLASLLTGVVQSVGTPWGLLRHHWIVLKLVLTVGATLLLLLHTRAIGRAADLAAGSVSGTPFRSLQIQLLVDAGLAVLVLLVATTVSVYKPWGRTRYGRRKEQEQVDAVPRAGAPTTLVRWLVALAVAGLVALVAVLHLAGVIGGH